MEWCMHQHSSSQMIEWVVAPALQLIDDGMGACTSTPAYRRWNGCMHQHSSLQTMEWECSSTALPVQMIEWVHAPALQLIDNGMGACTRTPAIDDGMGVCTSTPVYRRWNGCMHQPHYCCSDLVPLIGIRSY